MSDDEAYTGDEPFYFVCYSHLDIKVVEAEMAWLREAGTHLWFDEGIQVGSTWRAALADALDQSAGLIFMCSRHSIKANNLKQREVASLLGISQPRVSTLMKGDFESFRLDTLVAFTVKCGHTVSIDAA